MSAARKMMTTQVKTVAGRELSVIDMNKTKSIYELTTLVPIKNYTGLYPSLSDSLVEKSDGVVVNLDRINSKNPKTHEKEYGVVKEIVLPKKLVFDNPQMKIRPLELEYVSYIPFEEKGVRFLMVSLIEFGKPRDYNSQDEHTPTSMVSRYVYHCDMDNLRYLVSYQDALDCIMGKCLSN